MNRHGISAVGSIRAGLVAAGGMPDFRVQRPNVITYTAADIMARIAAGDTEYIPRHIGFIYGTTDSPSLPVPDEQTGTALRAHPWSTIRSQVASITGNMIIAPLSLKAAVALPTGADATLYSANAATFVARSDNVQEYAFTPGGTYADTVEDILDASGSVYCYQAVLLSRIQRAATVTYLPFARVALADEPFTALPTGRAWIVEWTIEFN